MNNHCHQSAETGRPTPRRREHTPTTDEQWAEKHAIPTVGGSSASRSRDTTPPSFSCQRGVENPGH
jgi:hypothetical protein